MYTQLFISVIVLLYVIFYCVYSSTYYALITMSRIIDCFIQMHECMTAMLRAIDRDEQQTKLQQQGRVQLFRDKDEEHQPNLIANTTGICKNISLQSSGTLKIISH